MTTSLRPDLHVIDPYEIIPQPSVGVVCEPAAMNGARLEGTTAVVIDAIRATTTIVSALAAGATEVVPFKTRDEVLAEKARRSNGSVVTAGERQGVRIDGLDLNNSPSVMTPALVGGRALLLTTTNGTGAILAARRAEEVLVAALPNRRAVARALIKRGRRVAIVQAGTVGTVSCEDALVAGAIIEAMAEEPGGERFELEDSGLLALAAWQGARDRLGDLFRQTWGGSFLVTLGLEADLDACTRVDSIRVVPVVRGDPPAVRPDSDG